MYYKKHTRVCSKDRRRIDAVFIEYVQLNIFINIEPRERFIP